MSFFLEYRCSDPELTGVWGPFDTRGQANDFAVALGKKGAAWVTVALKNPDAYTFPESG